MPGRDGDDLMENFNENLRSFTEEFEGRRAIPYITDRPENSTHPRYDRKAVIGSMRRGGGE